MINPTLVVFPNIAIPRLSNITRKWSITWKIHHDSEALVLVGLSHTSSGRFHDSFFLTLSAQWYLEHNQQNTILNLNYLLICLFEPLHSKVFEDKDFVLFIFASTAFSMCLSHCKNAINLCHIKEGGGEEGLWLFFFNIDNFFLTDLSKIQYSLLTV